jgi:hypothetical protein
VTIFGHDLLDVAGCFTFGKFREDVMGLGNWIAPVQAGSGRWEEATPSFAKASGSDVVLCGFTR